MSIFYCPNIKRHKDVLIDWIRLNQNDINVKSFKMNRNTYNYLKAEIVETITLTTDGFKELGMLEQYLMSVPIVFDEDIVDFMIKTE